MHRRRTTTFLSVPPIPPYYRQLLDTAQAYRRQEEYDVAVIVAQTASELVTESAFETLFRVHGVTEKDRKHLLPRSYNLTNDRVKALYVLLSHDKIQRQTFWSGFKEHVELRNGIVHKGEKAKARQAQASLDAVTELIAHVEAVIANASAVE